MYPRSQALSQILSQLRESEPWQRGYQKDDCLLCVFEVVSMYFSLVVLHTGRVGPRFYSKGTFSFWYNIASVSPFVGMCHTIMRGVVIIM